MADPEPGDTAALRNPIPRRLLRVVPLAVTGFLIMVSGWEVLRALTLPSDRLGYVVGGDFALYRDAAAGWLRGEPFYLARQLGGPYEIMNGDRLYPPVTLLLFIPFVWLPTLLWWAIPLGATAWVVRGHRPDPVGWSLMALCLWWPVSIIKIATGNPVIWALAALALGTRFHWPAVFAALKLTLGPFALWGIRHRSWWLAAGSLVLLSALFAPMWPDYARVILDARDPTGAGYSLGEVPLLCLPIVAWLRRRRPDPVAAAG